MDNSIEKGVKMCLSGYWGTSFYVDSYVLFKLFCNVFELYMKHSIVMTNVW